MSDLESILADIRSSENAAAAKLGWNPPQQGHIDIRIAADGAWYHEGRRFRRDNLVRLFASVLRREEDDYFLVTPAEKLRIEVEDAPFVATLVETIDHEGRQAIVFTTSIGERILLDREHALRVEIDAQTREPRPYVQMHAGLEALISRSAFYDLLNLAEERECEGCKTLVVSSLGHEFELGSSDE